MNNSNFDAGFVPVEGRGVKNAFMIDVLKFDGKDPDTIKYLLLLTVFGDEMDYVEEDSSKEWMVITGRQNVYDYLKNCIEAEGIDPDKSFIVAEDTDFTNCPTVYRFMKAAKESESVVDNTSFDIDDYRWSSYEEDPQIIDYETIDAADDNEEVW